MVATTTLLSLLAVAVAGAYLAGRISDQLFDSRRDQALTEARRGALDAQTRFDQFTASNTYEVQLQAQTLLGQLEGVGLDRDRTVLLLQLPRTDPSVSIGTALSSATDGPSTVPDALRAAVRRNGTTQQYQSISVIDAEGRVRPWLAVGSLVKVPISGDYELYFLFDLSREQATLDAVQRTLLVGAFVLVMLVGGVTAAVVHQVVQPVRAAAAVASRMGDGHLGDRMEVKGEDDLARLAASFNAMAASLEQQITELEQLGTLQQRFVSDVSHELRTPLTTIRMAGEVIHDAREDFPPAVSRSAELLYTQLDRFEDLLADLLEISRYDAGAAALDAERVDVALLVRRVVEAAAPLAERRGSDLVVRVHPALTADDDGAGGCTAEVDRRRVERILRNLVVNAIEHGEGQPVEIDVAVDAVAVAVRVRDHGVGLSPTDAARVFDRFWRADLARARTTGGTGLGLAISREDALLHGGRLEVSGRPGQGATFLLTLPRDREAQLGAGSPLALRPLLQITAVNGV
ncbi:two-component system, OmpR family, sensor histidine kinase MtrB [Quadrisphaera granulorum]|uniref:Sensor histidine kinase MtrB n=1 Tax=Quadrisphaera granulorum TaxID=317664 RepID=A0A316AB09_9ACTN|nr:two-component system sensor histidine kinase MtrB [Quadrisphaera granulorum]SZE95757.1 two-component system, OmpR family, sensor histidine kinase MtrB [Quadrisphaera granulorum]